MELSAREKRSFAFICLLVLLFQNLALYGRHYAGRAGFPFDFPIGFALNFYWITNIQLGHFPQWVSEQSMGHPLLMNLQSGLFYPGYWLFMLFGKTYSLHAAIVMQCLHILLGAVGMFVFCRRLQMTSLVALPAAVAYQFFGGFFSAAGHMEIVRSYAILPWLLSALILPKTPTKGLWAAILIPLTVYMQFTGGYLGVSMAMLFLLPILLVAQVAGRPIPMAQKTVPVFRCLALIAGGVLLASVHWLPAFLNLGELLRSNGYRAESVHYFKLEHFFTFFLSEHSPVLWGDVSMRSAFITLPVFVMLFFIRIEQLKKYLPLVVVMLISVLMIMATPFYTLMKTLFPFLGFSRMLAADYRAFLAIPLIVLSVAALQGLLENRPTPLSLALRAVTAGLVVFMGSRVLQVQINHLFYVIHACVFIAVFILFTLLRVSRTTLILIFTAGILANGFEMHALFPRQWASADCGSHYEEEFNSYSDSSGETYDFSRQVVAASSLRHHLQAPRAFRPARRESTIPLYPKIQAYAYDWRGYLTGDFMLGDYGGGMALTRHFAARKDPILKPFMLEQSRVLLLPIGQPMDLESVKSAVSRGVNEVGSVGMIQYSEEGPVYEINLPFAGIILENEMYFPGWRGLITTRSGEKTLIRPIAAGGLLRAWSLPAGNYEFRESFEMPFLKLAGALSTFTLVLWAAYVLMLIKRARPVKA